MKSKEVFLQAGLRIRKLHVGLVILTMSGSSTSPEHLTALRGLVYEGDIPVAEIDYYFDGDEVGGLCFAVNPTLRRQGFARKMLEEFMGREAFKEVRCFRAWVDHENEVSCRLLESSGFTVLVTQPDDQGYLEYVLERN
jgi:GNAT superfamily N-acetyltransferase